MFVRGADLLGAGAPLPAAPALAALAMRSLALAIIVAIWLLRHYL